MGKSTPDPPPVPDPYKTASAQGTSNANTATAQTALNNANTYTPYGSTTYQVTGQQEINNPDGTKTTVPTYTSTQTLSKAQQALLDQNNGLGFRTNVIAGRALNNVAGTLSHPITQDQIGKLQTSVGAAPTLATGYDAGPALKYGYDSGGAIQKDVKLNANAPTTFGQTAQGIDYFRPQDSTAMALRAQNAVLDRLAPSMASQDESLNARLASQGLVQGSAAWNAAKLSQSQAQNDLRLGAVQVGDAEQQQLFGQQATTNQLRNAAQQQDYSQLLGRGQFAQAGIKQNNEALLDMGNFHNAAQAQGNLQNAAAAGFHNQTVGQQNAQSAALAAFGNTAAMQDYQNRLSGGAFTNSAIAQQLQQAMALQNQQINQISALRSGGQVAGYQGTGYNPGTLDQTPISADVYQSAGLQNQQYMAQLQNQAQNTAAMGSAIGGLFGGMGKKSDRRLKSEVSRVATARNGLPVYRYRLAGEDGWHVGMMADEVALVRPDAVWTDPGDGWARVNYERAVA